MNLINHQILGYSIFRPCPGGILYFLDLTISVHKTPKISQNHFWCWRINWWHLDYAKKKLVTQVQPYCALLLSSCIPTGRMATEKGIDKKHRLETYSGWKKSCTLDGWNMLKHVKTCWNPMNHLSTGARLLPSYIYIYRIILSFWSKFKISCQYLVGGMMRTCPSLKSDSASH